MVQLGITPVRSQHRPRSTEWELAGAEELSFSVDSRQRDAVAMLRQFSHTCTTPGAADDSFATRTAPSPVSQKAVPKGKPLEKPNVVPTGSSKKRSEVPNWNANRSLSVNNGLRPPRVPSSIKRKLAIARSRREEEEAEQRAHSTLAFRADDEEVVNRPPFPRATSTDASMHVRLRSPSPDRTHHGADKVNVQPSSVIDRTSRAAQVVRHLTSLGYSLQGFWKLQADRDATTVEKFVTDRQLNLVAFRDWLAEAPSLEELPAVDEEQPVPLEERQRIIALNGKYESERAIREVAKEVEQRKKILAAVIGYVDRDFLKGKHNAVPVISETDRNSPIAHLLGHDRPRAHSSMSGSSSTMLSKGHLLTEKRRQERRYSDDPYGREVKRGQMQVGHDAAGDSDTGTQGSKVDLRRLWQTQTAKDGLLLGDFASIYALQAEDVTDWLHKPHLGETYMDTKVRLYLEESAAMRQNFLSTLDILGMTADQFCQQEKDATPGDLASWLSGSTNYHRKTVRAVWLWYKRRREEFRIQSLPKNPARFLEPHVLTEHEFSGPVEERVVLLPRMQHPTAKKKRVKPDAFGLELVVAQRRGFAERVGRESTKASTTLLDMLRAPMEATKSEIPRLRESLLNHRAKAVEAAKKRPKNLDDNDSELKAKPGRHLKPDV